MYVHYVPNPSGIYEDILIDKLKYLTAGCIGYQVREWQKSQGFILGGPISLYMRLGMGPIRSSIGIRSDTNIIQWVNQFETLTVTVSGFRIFRTFLYTYLKLPFGTYMHTYISYLPVERTLFQAHIKSTIMIIIILKRKVLWHWSSLSIDRYPNSGIGIRLEVKKCGWNNVGSF